MSVNKVILIGRLGADPEAITFQNGGMVTNFSLATSERWTDRNGQRQERTEWHKVKLNGKLAEIGMRLLKKGSQVYLEGSLKTRQWTDNNGSNRYITEVHANMLNVLVFANDRQEQAEPTMSLAEPNVPPQMTSQPSTNQQANTQVDDFDDDIPF